MVTIDLIVLGILKEEPLGAYDIQKLVEYHSTSRWVKISTPSIYKEVIQLKEKGYIVSSIVREGRTAEKTVYSLTEQGNGEFGHLMEEIASKPIHILLDFNAVMINLDSVTPEKQKACLERIEDNIETLKTYLEESVSMKEGEPKILRTGMAVSKQQQILAFAAGD